MIVTMKTLIVGDIHAKYGRVRKVVDNAVDAVGDVDSVVFVGDLVDDWGLEASEQVECLHLFVEGVKSLTDAGVDVTVLVGNHDLIYLMDERDPLFPFVAMRSPGFIPKSHGDVHRMLTALGMKLSTVVDTDRVQVLVSHAGVTTTFWELLNGTGSNPSPSEVSEVVNMLLEAKAWDVLSLCGPERGGVDFTSSVVWTGARELMSDPVLLPQVVGHTPVRTVETPSPTLPITFVDTFSTDWDGNPIGDGSVLVIDRESSRFRSFSTRMWV